MYGLSTKYLWLRWKIRTMTMETYLKQKIKQSILVIKNEHSFMIGWNFLWLAEIRFKNFPFKQKNINLLIQLTYIFVLFSSKFLILIFWCKNCIFTALEENFLTSFESTLWPGSSVLGLMVSAVMLKRLIWEFPKAPFHTRPEAL